MFRKSNSDSYVDVGGNRQSESNIQGVVLNQSYQSNTVQSNTASNNKGACTWKINIILILLSCWFAMELTSWGSVKAEGSIANPEVGNVSMWMIMAWQWLGLILYLWTLVAPRLFPDRDFS